MSRLRLLMTADTIGGVWSYALDLTAGLAQYDVEVVLATMGRPLSAAQRAATAKLNNLDVRESSYALEWMPNPWAEVDAAGEWLVQLSEDLRPDLVHLNGYCHAALPFQVPSLVVCHSCVCSWWGAVKGAEAPADWDEYRSRVTRGLQAANAVVAPTRSILEAVFACYSLSRPSAPRRHVIFNGVDKSRYRPLPKEPFVLGAGRLWDDAKNLRVLDELHDLAWPIYLAGSSEQPRSAAAAVHGQALRLGELSASELATWMGRASIYVLPALYEPFGLSAVEAALSGCALLLADIPTLREVWEDVPLYVEPRSAEDVREKLTWLAAHPTDLQQVALRCARHAQRFAHTKMAHDYLSLYDRLTTAPLAVSEGVV